MAGVVCTAQKGVKCHRHHQECLALVLPPKMPWDNNQIPQAPRASWKDVPRVDLDMLILLVALPQAVLLFGTRQSGTGPSKFRAFLMAARGKNILDPFIFARERRGDFVIKLCTSSCYGAFPSACIHQPEESGSV